MSKHQWNYISFGLLSLAFAYVYVFHGWLIWYWLILLVIWFGIVVYGSFSIKANYYLYAINKIETTKKIVALTFDDGPTSHTLEILDLLKNHDAKATFFCIGKQIEMYPDIFKRIIQEGHNVGNHTYSHDKSMGFKKTKELIYEIKKNNDIISQVSGKRTLLFRPPFGVTNPRFRRALSATQMTAVGWSIRSLDTVVKDESKIMSRIEKNIQPGSIILLHDTSQKSVNVLARLLACLSSNSYKSVLLEPELK
jgi:peptidoglycan-N-acetylglucosamine deacetylase